MEYLLQALMVFIVLSNLVLLSSGRLAACIRTVAMQGLVLGLLPVILALHGAFSARLVFLAAAGIGLRGILFPRFLFRAMRQAGVYREIKPFIGYSLSLLSGVAGLLAAFWFSSFLPAAGTSPLMVPAALATVFTGLFIITSRRLALNQVLGYLVMENGIYVLGLALVEDIPALLELGVLLDAFMAVFVMSIAMYHIQRHFDHMETDQLDSLKG
jgi:hydrogenase-4 component E